MNVVRNENIFVCSVPDMCHIMTLMFYIVSILSSLYGFLMVRKQTLLVEPVSFESGQVRLLLVLKGNKRDRHFISKRSHSYRVYCDFYCPCGSTLSNASSALCDLCWYAVKSTTMKQKQF